MATEKELKLIESYCKGRGLNIGCGLRPIPGAINVDIAPKALADVFAPASMLPFYSNRFDYVVSSHCLEHVQEAPLIILREWHRVLKVGGTLAFIVPDGRCGLHALGEFPGIFIEGKHVNTFDQPTLLNLMMYAGFVDINFITMKREEWKSRTIFATGKKLKESSEEIPGDSFRAYLLWLGAVRKTVTPLGLLKWLRHKW
jgi:predicted SAM-dependent methyltransferase